MLRSFHRLITRLALLLMVILSTLPVILLAQPPVSGEVKDAHAYAPDLQTPDSYLILSVDPPIVTTGTLVTLSIAYHNIGLQQTTIEIDPPGLVEFSPPLTMPCPFNGPDSCTKFTLHALAPGRVTFR